MSEPSKMKAFWQRLGKQWPVPYFILLNLIFGLLGWVLHSVIVPAGLYAKWDITSLFGWLWLGAVLAFLCYRSLMKKNN